MKKIGRPRTCECGECARCKQRERARKWWNSLSKERRREIVLARDIEKARATDRARYYRHREERLAQNRRWAEENKERATEAKLRWAERNKEKRLVHNEVQKAIQRGDLIKQPCEECGSTVRIHGHHDDYNKPLEVRWLCPAHHSEAHRRYQR